MWMLQGLVEQSKKAENNAGHRSSTMEMFIMTLGKLPFLRALDGLGLEQYNVSLQIVLSAACLLSALPSC